MFSHFFRQRKDQPPLTKRGTELQNSTQTKPLRGGKTAAILILSLWERLSNREKSWQNATHTVSGNEPERIMRITEKNLAMCKKMV
jgi:hypothetical protein